MTSQWLFTGLVLLVGIERLAELVVSKRHAAWAFSRGGVERGQSHYPVMVVLHTGLLVGAVASQALRWWCISTLGNQWNPRVIVVPGLSLVRRGPYGLVPHPNYVAVVVEGLALPLVHTAWVTALVFTVANAALLAVRIRVENAALREIASPASTPSGATT